MVNSYKPIINPLQILYKHSIAIKLKKPSKKPPTLSSRYRDITADKKFHEK